MRDLKADWQRWTRVERIAAMSIALMIPALLILGQG